MKAIGAKQTYQECPNGPYNKFVSTGDGELGLVSRHVKFCENLSNHPKQTLVQPFRNSAA